MPITFYDSLREFHASLPRKTARSEDCAQEDWNGGHTYASAKQALFTGDAKALAASDRLLEKVEGEGLELASAFWDNSRVGAMPCVPAFLAGSPDSMYALTDTQSDTSPIKIFVDVCLSAGFTAKQLMQRGTAILALARKLQAIRPVELWLFSSMDGSDSGDGYGDCAIPVVKIDTSPLDLTTASFAICNAGFLRQLCFAWGYDSRGFSGSWAWRGSPSSNRKKLVEHFNIDESKDMLIDGAYLSDKLMSDPVGWVNDQVRRYASVLEDRA